MGIRGFLIAVGVASLSLAACVSTGGDQFSSRKLADGLQGGFRPSESLESYPTINSFQRRGRIQETGDYYNYSPEPRRIEIIPVEVPFSTDSKILLAPKRVSVLGGCARDKVTDRTTCHMNILPQGVRRGGGLFQIVDASGNLKSSCILGHDFPGRRGVIRVDGNAAITTDTDGCIYGSTARRLQSQLLTGQHLITRYVEWPYDYSKDREMLIGGSFRSAQELYRWSAGADLQTLFSAR